MSDIEIGSAWIHKKMGGSVVVLSEIRTGHQYDRYWLLEALTEKGEIIKIEDYVLLSEYQALALCEEGQEKNDSSTI